MIPVVAAIVFKAETILIARRSAGKDLAGYWEFPGGKMEAGETPEASLHRELMEELGIKVTIDCFLMENEYHYAQKSILLKAYLCTFISGKIELNDHDELRWVEKIELGNFRFAPADIPFIGALNNL